MSTLSAPSGVGPVRHGAPRRPGGMARSLALAAIGPLVTSYAVVAALLALVVALAPGAAFGTVGVLVAAGPAWLAVYHVPVELAGHQLGALPLLPTVLAMAMVARTAANAARRLELTTPRSSVPVIVVVGLSHAAFGAVLAVVCSRGPVACSPVAAGCAAGAFAALAATAGVARPAGFLPAALDRATDATAVGLRAGALGALALFGAGAAVVTLGLLLSWPAAGEVFRHGAPGVGAGLGVLLLCVAYLPNAAVGALSFAAGPGFTLGSATVAQWRFHAGPVPPLPLLVTVPTEPARWWILLLALPAGVGALVGLHCRRSLDGLAARLRAVLVAALVSGVAFLVLAGLAGGALAGGPFDPVTVPAGLLGAAAFGWVGLVGALVCAFGRWSPLAVLLPEPEPFDDPEPPPDPEDDPEPPDPEEAEDAAAETGTGDADTDEPEERE